MMILVLFAIVFIFFGHGYYTDANTYARCISLAVDYSICCTLSECPQLCAHISHTPKTLHLSVYKYFDACLQ